MTINKQPVEQKRLFVYIETEVQFDAIMPLLIHLRDVRKISFDIIVPVDENGENMEIYNETAKLIQRSGFKIERGILDRIKKRKYQILLSSYIYNWLYNEIKAKYFIQYAYGSYYFNKPNWTVDRLLTGEYMADAVLSHAVGTQDAVNVVSKSYITPELRFSDFRKKVRKNGEKPTLFFVTTYNDMAFAVRLLEVVDELKKKYRLIFHGHHRAVHVHANKELTERLYDKADRVYDSEQTMKAPLEDADIVLSDNSSAFLEAISVGIPVALFSRNLNAFKYREINAIQYDLVQNGDILWTDDPKKLLRILDQTLTGPMLKRQSEMSAKLFPEKFSDPVGRYMEILDIYLEDKLPPEYHLVKKYWVERINGLVIGNDEKRDRIEYLESEMASLLGIGRSARLLASNIKRHIMKGEKGNR